MLIASSNWMHVVNLDNIDTLSIVPDGEGKFQINALNQQEFTIVGVFKGVEQAQFVLKQIVTSYSNNQNVFIMP